MNKTKKLTHGAMLLAIIGAAMLIDRQLSFLFENFIFMAVPVIIIIYSTMYTVGDGGILCFGVLVMGILFGSIYAYASIPLAIIVGIGVSLAIKKDLKSRSLLFIAMLTYIIGEVLISLLIMPLLGIDIATQVAEISTVFSNYNFADMMSQVSINFDNFLVVLFIAAIIMTGMMEGFFVYFISTVLLRRLKIKDVGVSSALDLRISPLTSYILFILTMMFFVAMKGPSFIRENETLYYIVLCISVIASMILFYYGYIFASIYLKLIIGKKFIIILLLGIIFLFPVSYYVLVIVGFLYGAGPLRNKLEERLAQIKKNEKE